MANDTITFPCPACGIRLTVPGSLAGVTGPCPSCSTLIQAPYPAPAPIQAPAPAPVVQPVYQPQAAYQGYAEPPAPVYQPVPTYIPAPAQTAAPAPAPTQPAYQPQAAYPGYAQPPAPASHPVPTHIPGPAQTAAPAPAPTQPVYHQQAAYPGYAQPPAPAQTAAPAPVQPMYQPQAAYPGYSEQPAPASQPVPTYIPGPAQTAAPAPAPTQPVYQPQAAYAGYAEPPAPASYAIPAYVPDSVQTAIPVQAPVQAPASAPSPAAVRPEPRQLPNRQSHGEPVAKQMPEPNRNEKHSKVAHALPRHPKQRSPFLRFSILVLFLTAMVALVIGVKTVLTNQTKVDPPSNGKPRESTVRTILPENDQPPKTQETPKQESIPSLPVSDPEQPVIVDPAPVLPEGMEPAVPGEAANDALEKFLAAKTLEERMPMMETRTPATELEKSCLAGVLPPTLSMLNDGQETNAIEQVVDIYFSVEFDAGNNQTNAQTILVRTRGTGEPKIVADPFLDSFGGRLAAYAKTPSNKAGTFQVIISPVASCNDEKVPNREKKLTLKLLPRDNTKEIARAYFGRQSKIGSMLEDGTYSLSYGKARACTVMLRWNAEDNPQAPYLEALNLKSLDWNP